MRLVLREKANIKEAEDTSKKFTVHMEPETFLKLTLPKADFEYVKAFVKKAGSDTDPSQLEALAKDLEAEYDKMINPRKGFTYAEIGKNVIERAISLVKRESGYDEEKAGIALNIKYGKYQTFVTNHGGRATSLFAILSGVEDVPVIINGISQEQLKGVDKIISQDFGFEKSNVSPQEITF